MSSMVAYLAFHKLYTRWCLLLPLCMSYWLFDKSFEDFRSNLTPNQRQPYNILGSLRWEQDNSRYVWMKHLLSTLLRSSSSHCSVFTAMKMNELRSIKQRCRNCNKTITLTWDALTYVYLLFWFLGTWKFGVEILGKRFLPLCTLRAVDIHEHQNVRESWGSTLNVQKLIDALGISEGYQNFYITYILTNSKEGTLSIATMVASTCIRVTWQQMSKCTFTKQFRFNRIVGTHR